MIEIAAILSGAAQRYAGAVMVVRSRGRTITSSTSNDEEILVKQSMNKLVNLITTSALALGVATAVFAADRRGTSGNAGTMGEPGMMGGRVWERA